MDKDINRLCKRQPLLCSVGDKRLPAKPGGEGSDEPCRALRVVEKRLEHHPQLPKWDILIRPASTW
jgi:hypothetical protein